MLPNTGENKDRAHAIKMQMVQLEKGSSVIPDVAFLKEVEKESGELVSSCFQCKKCSSGCPVWFAMDYLPHRLLHMINMGMKDEVLKSSTIWICTDCETCFTRCPNEINIPRMTDVLGRMAMRSGIARKEKRVSVFHKVFLQSIKKKGRIHELEMIQKYTFKSGDLKERLKTGEFIKDAKLGWEMFRRGKLRLFAKGIKGMREVKDIFSSSKGKNR